MKDNKQAAKRAKYYVDRKIAIGWKRKGFLAPPEVIEQITKTYKKAMLEYKLKEITNEQK